jgi:hypothetical protein
MKSHLTNDELVDLLYGVGGDPGSHLNGCRECSERFEELRERKAMAAEPAPVPWDFLAAQRRNIYARMGKRPQAGVAHWVPALAAVVCLIAVGLFSYHPEHATKAEIIDTQLFSDVYSMEQSMEPIAAQPIHALFEQDQP